MNEGLDGFLNAPENAQELVAGGTPDDSTPRGKAQKAILNGWLETLEQARVMDHVIAAYETVSLLAEYSPPINAQQLKNALVSRKERNRVEQLIADHGRLSLASLDAAGKHVATLRGSDRSKLAGRFLGDFMRYHRDLRRLEALNYALDSVNIIGNEKMRELSALNRLLYEFLLRDGQVCINELAPRPHNSAHYTIEACWTSQFENHVRAVLGLPLGDGALRTPAAAMVNLLGTTHAPVRGAELAAPHAFVHLYGKTENRPGRKMGHVTALGSSVDDALGHARAAAARIEL